MVVVFVVVEMWFDIGCFCGFGFVLVLVVYVLVGLQFGFLFIVCVCGLTFVVCLFAGLLDLCCLCLAWWFAVVAVGLVGGLEIWLLLNLVCFLWC